MIPVWDLPENNVFEVYLSQWNYMLPYFLRRPFTQLGQKSFCFYLALHNDEIFSNVYAYTHEHWSDTLT